MRMRGGGMGVCGKEGRAAGPARQPPDLASGADDVFPGERAATFLASRSLPQVAARPGGKPQRLPAENRRAQRTRRRRCRPRPSVGPRPARSWLNGVEKSPGWRVRSGSPLRHQTEHYETSLQAVEGRAPNPYLQARPGIGYGGFFGEVHSCWDVGLSSRQRKYAVCAHAYPIGLLWKLQSNGASGCLGWRRQSIALTTITNRIVIYFGCAFRDVMK